MATVKPMSLAFIGGGLNSAVGETHFIASQMDGYFRVEAGCFSLDQEINAATARRWGVSEDRVYRDAGALIDAEACRADAIVVLTPTPDHSDQVIRALEAGGSVFCEKALAASVPEAERIARCKAALGGAVFVFFNYTGYPMVRELRSLALSGALGEITRIQIEMPQEGFLRIGPDGDPVLPQSWRLRDGDIPTISLDLGVHVHSLLRFVIEQRPVEVVARQSSFGNFPPLIDDVAGMAMCDRGARLDFWYSKSAAGYRNGLRVRVFGSEGSAEWVQTAPEYLRLADRMGRVENMDRASPGAKISAEGRYNRFKAGHPAGFLEAFANLYRDFAQALRARAEGSGDAVPLVCDVTESLQGLRFLEAVARSAKERAWVTVP